MQAYCEGFPGFWRNPPTSLVANNLHVCCGFLSVSLTNKYSTKLLVWDFLPLVCEKQKEGIVDLWRDSRIS